MYRGIREPLSGVLLHAMVQTKHTYFEKKTEMGPELYVTYMYGPGSPPKALKHKQVSSTMTGPLIYGIKDMYQNGKLKTKRAPGENKPNWINLIPLHCYG